ncbi:hypothetical protein CDAR_607161 [Caerostris darwini]|uniref:Uncharacterized protein n=1 Tax=Caerostris darwini TaxID=1538125 RepID=A0AAV4QHM0_9ARAC|nr:hypothetical protein CDAR_607161 [Caerostris darwini]
MKLQACRFDLRLHESRKFTGKKIIHCEVTEFFKTLLEMQNSPLFRTNERNEQKGIRMREIDGRSFRKKKGEGIFLDGYSDKINKTRRVSNHSLIAPSNEERSFGRGVLSVTSAIFQVPSVRPNSFGMHSLNSIHRDFA